MIGIDSLVRFGGLGVFISLNHCDKDKERGEVRSYSGVDVQREESDAV